MYKYILRYFNHDKEGGLEYADMELNYLANYEKAEEVLSKELINKYVSEKDTTKSLPCEDVLITDLIFESLTSEGIEDLMNTFIEKYK